MKWFLSLSRCHFQPRVTAVHEWLQMALSEKWKPMNGIIQPVEINCPSRALIISRTNSRVLLAAWILRRLFLIENLYHCSSVDYELYHITWCSKSSLKTSFITFWKECWKWFFLPLLKVILLHSKLNWLIGTIHPSLTDYLTLMFISTFYWVHWLLAAASFPWEFLHSNGFWLHQK